MKKKKAGLILAALIAMGSVSAQAAITPDEQNQIVTAVLERLEKEKKVSHYVSINGTDTAAGLNYDNKAATGQHAMVIGENSTAIRRNGVSIGANNRNEGYETTLVGTGNKAYGVDKGYEWASNGTAIGYNNTIMSMSGKLAAGSDNIVDDGMALGQGNEAMGQRSVAIGTSTHAYFTDTIAMGFGSKAFSTDVIAMGNAAEGHAVGGVAIGHAAIVKKDAGAGVALGYESVADRSGGVIGYMPGADAQTSEEVAKYLGKEQEYAAWKTDRKAKQDVYDKYKAWHAAVDADEAAKREVIDARIAYAKKPTDANKKIIEEKKEAYKKTNEARGIASRAITKEDRDAYNDLNARYGQIFGKYISRSGAVSVGDAEKGITRQIINVAAGSEDTDAVNVSQLKALDDKVADSLKSASTHFFSVGPKSGTTPQDDTVVNWDNKGATGENALAIGPNSTAIFKQGISIGANNRNEGYYSTLIGSENKAYGMAPGNTWAYGATAVGYNNTIMSTNGVLAAGSKNIVYDGMALGQGNEAMGQRSVAIGTSNHAYFTDTIAMGFGSKAFSTDVIAMGNAAEGHAVGGVAIGKTAIVKKDAGAGVALGYQSVADRSGGVIGYMPGADAQTSEEVAKYLGKEQEYAAWKTDREANQDIYDKYKAWHAAVDADEAAKRELIDARILYAEDSTDVNKKAIEEKYNAQKQTEAARGVAERAITKEEWKTFNDLNARYGQIFGKYISRSGAVSVGDAEKGITRQIINVAAGSEDTDAVNVSQLKDAVKTMKNSVAGDLESKADADAGNLTAENVAAWQTKLGDGKNEAGNKGLVTGDTLNKAIGGLNLDGNLANKADKNAGNLEDADKDAWRAALGGGTVAKGDKKFVDGDTVAAALENMGGQVTGKANTSLDNITDAGKTVIKDLAKGAVKVADGEHTTVTTENNADGVTYKVNVTADGKVAKDDKGIVTGGTVYAETRPAQDGTYIKAGNTAGQNFTAMDRQVGKNAEEITKLGSTVYDMGNRVGELDSRMNKVGAGAAALAALHPQDFDPEDKWDIAAGFGNYKNANAAALGLFYRPNERTMLNLGWTMGDSRNMMNAGVSVKLGSGSTYAGLSKVQMATRLTQQEERIKQQDEELARQKEQIREILAQLEEMKKA